MTNFPLSEGTFAEKLSKSWIPLMKKCPAEQVSELIYVSATISSLNVYIYIQGDSLRMYHIITEETSTKHKDLT